MLHPQTILPADHIYHTNLHIAVRSYFCYNYYISLCESEILPYHYAICASWSTSSLVPRLLMGGASTYLIASNLPIRNLVARQ